MKKWYKILFITILACSPTLSFSQVQERIDSSYFNFNSQSKQIKHCSLWTYDEITMKWKEDKSSDGLTYLQSFTCNYNGVPYYVLLWAYRNGKYEYEYIQEGWYTWPEYFCLIFEEDEWNKYQSLNSSTIRLDAIYSTENITYFGHDYDVNDFVHNAIVKKQNNQTSHSLFISKTNDGKIRFARVKLDNSKRYFETSVEQFNTLMISNPEESEQTTVQVNPGDTEASLRTMLAIGSSVFGILIGIVIAVLL